MRNLLLAIFLLQALQSATAQTAGIQAGGYLRSMLSLSYLDDTGEIQSTLLLHQRTNLSWNIIPDVVFNTGIRTRYFAGDGAKVPGTAALFAAQGNDVLNFSQVWFAQKRHFLLSTVDRLNIQWRHAATEITAGRQRINWGVSSIWNPNDLFNTYAFTDFDYSERPGADALRITHFLDETSGIDAAIKPGNNKRLTSGIRYFTNWRSSDIQVIAGTFERDLVLGLGTAVSAGGSMIKMEASYFEPLTDTVSRAIVATLSAEYQFDNGLYGSGGLLYNDAAPAGGAFQDLFSTDLDARRLFPFTWAGVLSGGGALTPLISVNGAVIYTPAASHLTFVQSSASVSIASNWDLAAFYQSVLTIKKGGPEIPLHAFFLRTQWSF
jgi:hypothetical protein